MPDTYVGRRIKDTFGDVLHLDSANFGIVSALKRLRDGRGVASPLEISLTEVKVTGTLTVSGTLNADASDFGEMAGNAETATALKAGGADRTKLDGIAAGATANQTDAYLLARANHTGTQAISTVTALQAALDALAPLASPALTGTPTGPTASAATSTTQLATTAFVTTADNLLAPKASPTFTGTVTAEALTTPGNVGIGTASPGARLTVNNNALGATLPTPPADSVANFVGADGGQNRVILDTFGGTANYSGRRANGTVASKTAVTTGDALLTFAGFGYGATGYSGGRANVALIAAEPWTDTAQGTHVSISTTASGGTTISEKVFVLGNGNVGVGTASPGAKLDVRGYVWVPRGSSIQLVDSSNTAIRRNLARFDAGADTITFGDNDNSGDGPASYVFKASSGATRLTIDGSGYMIPKALTDAADDAAAATASVPVGALYRTGSTVKVRVA
jgi:hypothetical protein